MHLPQPLQKFLFIVTVNPLLCLGPRGITAAAAIAAASPFMRFEIFIPGGSARKSPFMEVDPGEKNGIQDMPAFCAEYSTILLGRSCW